MVPAIKMLNPRSAEYFLKDREETFGKKVEELATVEQWQAFERGLAKLKEALETNKAPGLLTLMGDRLTFSDLLVAAFLVWAKIVADEAWAKIAVLHGGMWARFVDQFSLYTETWM